MTLKSLQSALVYGNPKHANGTSTDTATDIITTTHLTPILEITIRNSGSTKTLGVSFDGGTTFFGLPPDGSLTKRGQFTQFHVKSYSAGLHTTYESLLSESAV